MKNLILTVTVALLTYTASSQQTQVANGIVFHDLNENGLREADEPGIARVAVSNGSDIVITDDMGRYSISISPEAEIFVIKPSNFSYSLNELNLPRFFYLHKHNRPPLLKYPGIERTGPLPESLDFPLLTVNYEESFNIILMSDPQTYSIDEVGYYNTDIVDELAGSQEYAFGITLGDIVGDDLDLFDPINKATARIGIPWFHVIGNHDINFDASDIFYSDERFKMIYGPSTYAFNHGKVHFIVLNNIIYPNAFTDYHYVGGIRDDQFEFITNSLELVPEDHLVVLCMHIPLYTEVQYGETFVDQHRQRLFEVLKNREFAVSLSGHTHSLRHYFFDATDGWLRETPHHHYTTGTASGDWWSGKLQANGVPESTMYDGTPNGYSIMRISGNQYTIDYKAAGKPADHKMRIHGPRKVPLNAHYRGSFYVNFFQGSENDLVEWRVNDGEWKKMRYTIEPDPAMYAAQYEWDHADILPKGTRPSTPVNCYHLWKARVPTRVPAGENTIYIRITDIAGRVYEESLKYEAVEQE